MIRYLSILLARFRYRALADELAAVERQLQQQVAHREYLLDAERKAAIALLIAEGGDVTDALRIAVQQERTLAARHEAFVPRQVAR